MTVLWGCDRQATNYRFYKQKISLDMHLKLKEQILAASLMIKQLQSLCVMCGDRYRNFIPNNASADDCFPH